MRLFVCEFVTGGGLRGEALPSDLCREGDAMLQALVKDLLDLARPPRQPDVDASLHADRVDRQGRQRHHDAPLDRLPDGCFVLLPDDPTPWLVHGTGLYAWTHAGYGRPVGRPAGINVSVITPASTVAALAAGYRPGVHDSVEQGGEAVQVSR